MPSFGFRAGINLIPVGHQQITSLAAAVGLTPPTETANVARVQAESQNVRMRDDGTNPTAAIGELLYSGDQATTLLGNLASYKFIEVAGGGKLNVSYYRAE